MKTSEEIRSEIAALDGQLASLAGEGLLVWDGREGDICDCPPGGATLTVEWATSQHSWERWFPTVEAAKARLVSVARGAGRKPDEDGWRADLTAPGCHSSRAYVTRRTAPALDFSVLTDQELLTEYGWRGAVSDTRNELAKWVDANLNIPMVLMAKSAELFDVPGHALGTDKDEAIRAGGLRKLLQIRETVTARKIRIRTTNRAVVVAGLQKAGIEIIGSEKGPEVRTREERQWLESGPVNYWITIHASFADLKNASEGMSLDASAPGEWFASRSGTQWSLSRRGVTLDNNFSPAAKRVPNTGMMPA